jgi:S-methylmethionine-dependent homocysteine/selenocysteine methylase
MSQTIVSLPHPGLKFVTDGGLETDLIFHHGVDMPHFAAFPLLDSSVGRGLLKDYYEGYAQVASKAEAGLELPVAISFTVETDGRLPSGMRLADAVLAVTETRLPTTSSSTAPTRTTSPQGSRSTATGAPVSVASA